MIIIRCTRCSRVLTYITRDLSLWNGCKMNNKLGRERRRSWESIIYYEDTCGPTWVYFLLLQRLTELTSCCESCRCCWSGPSWAFPDSTLSSNSAVSCCRRLSSSLALASSSSQVAICDSWLVNSAFRDEIYDVQANEKKGGLKRDM